MERFSFIPVKFIAFLVFLFVMGYGVQHFFDPISRFIRPPDAERVHDLSNLQKAIEEYYKYQGSYPRSSNTYMLIGFDGNPVSWGDGWTPYVKQLPVDPDTHKTYVYVADNTTRQSYKVYTSLNSPQNYFQACTAYRCDRAPAGACGIGAPIICNYGVSSANISP